jgi:hypothetical protein
VCKYLQKWFLNCCYKVNVIFRVTKNQGACVKDHYYKLLKLFAYEYVNILRNVLIIESMKNCYFYSALLLHLRKPVFKLISIRSYWDAGIQGLTVWLRPEKKNKEKGDYSLQQEPYNLGS